MVSCEDNDDLISNNESNNENGNIDNEDEKTSRKYFNVVVGIDVANNGSTYTAAYSNLSAKDMFISFNGWGFEVPSVRTSYVYTSQAGDFLYNLSYGGGTISKYSVHGGETYSQIKTLDISLAMGTNNPRWTKVNEEYASLHHVVTEHQFEGEEYTYTNAKIILTPIDLNNFAIVKKDDNSTGGVTFDMPRTEEDINESLHVWRIDAPVIYNGKAYYGVNKRSYNPETSANVSTSEYNSCAIVVDFPSLENPKVITSSVGRGSTQGYRTPVGHADEKGDVYQICTSAPTKFLKITNEDYDNSYDFDLSSALGMNSVGANGWFYVGNGIGYIPFYDAELATGTNVVAAWGVARVDIYNKTAVRLNLPENLWLAQYQNGVIGDDGLFYMAIAPMG